jgi:hypothetical protein
LLHIALHFLVPVLVALGFYRRHWRAAFAILLATMVVDVDHLLAEPIYDPQRCSIDFHPLHTTPAIVLYGALFVLPFFRGRKAGERFTWSTGSILQCIGLGLLIHMALDGIDCLL